MKSVKLIMRVAEFMVLVSLIGGCAGPIYLSKEFKKQSIKPVVYIVPSSYYGMFLYADNQSGKNSEVKGMKETPVNDWEMFDFNLNRCLLNSFKQEGINAMLLTDEQVPSELKTFIASDKLKNSYLQYLSLDDIYKETNGRISPEILSGLFLVFTKFEIKRVFPDIKIFTRYSIYNIEDGKLLLVNKIVKEYMMTGVTKNVFESSLGNPNVTNIINERFYGLKEDEKESYEKICSLHIEKIVAEVVKYCLKK